MIRARIGNLADRRLIRDDRRRLQDRDFTLIANDCFGGAVYQRYDVPYRTPLIGLMLMAPDYLELAENLDAALAAPLTFRSESRHADVRARHPGNAFPVGYLGGQIELLFVHYPTEKSARSVWERRRDRVDLGNVLLKFDGSKDLADDDTRSRFDALPFRRKLMVVREPHPFVSAVTVPRWVEDGHRVLRPLLEVFDVGAWIDGRDPGVARPVWERRLRRVAA